jgi:hypothetical protein
MSSHDNLGRSLTANLCGSSAGVDFVIDEVT